VTNPIKFCGRDFYTDEMWYGGCMQIIHTGTTYIVGGSGGGSHRKFYRVKPESVRQLVGYDSDGKEVYDGDELILTDEDGRVAAKEPFRLQFLDEFAECLPLGCKLQKGIQKGNEDD